MVFFNLLLLFNVNIFQQSFLWTEIHFPIDNICVNYPPFIECEEAYLPVVQ